jgi:hypothetical protein
MGDECASDPRVMNMPLDEGRAINLLQNVQGVGSSLRNVRAFSAEVLLRPKKKAPCSVIILSR